MTWTRQDGAGVVDLSQTLIRYGLSERIELRLGVPDFYRDVPSSTARLGFGDIALAVKRQLGPLPGQIGLSVIAGISLPTGANRVSTHGVDPFVKFPWSREVYGPWSIGGQTSIFYLTDQFRRNTLIEPCFYVARELQHGRREVFIEYAGGYHQRGAPEQLLHVGTTYRPNALNQVDAHVGFGLSQASPTVLIGLGWSFRMDMLRSRFNRSRSVGLH